MNKTAIKNFAVWARRKLISEITYKAGLYGITEAGIAQVSEPAKGIQVIPLGKAGQTEITGNEIAQRIAFVSAIHRKSHETDYKTAFQNVIEEVAYTWFNRIIAIRFMEVNDYLPSHIRILSSENLAKAEPDFVTTPFDTDLDFSPYQKDRVLQLKDENKLDELFQLLFIKQCNKLHEILPELFEKTNDYTELLLTISFTDKDGVVWHLVHDIEEKDFNINTIGEDGNPTGQVEIIGWLYQAYIAEPKDVLINARSKYKQDEMKLVTQIFTPDWIVRYMVENTIGRLWVEGHPNDVMKARWKYYLEEAEQEPSVQAKLDKVRADYKTIQPEDIKVIDPCMGSGHILIYTFDVLMQIYVAQGYTQRDAARLIVEKNLYGLDIDWRAYQLAYFSVMMKARQYNRRILNDGIIPNLHAIQDSTPITEEIIEYIANGDNKLRRAVQSIKDNLIDANEYGSIIDVAPVDFAALYDRFDEIKNMFCEDLMTQMNQNMCSTVVLTLVKQAQAMAQKYDVVVTNPPYMNSSYMPDKLKDFVIGKFPKYKSDLFSVFLYKNRIMCKKDGHLGFVTPYVWMFISSYESMRKEILSTMAITSMIQLEYNAFEGACVPVCTCTFRNDSIPSTGEYIKLSEFRGIENQAPKTLEAVRNPKCGYRHTACQSDYQSIPGSPIAYWVNKNLFALFATEQPLKNIARARSGAKTGNNDLFLKTWWEIDRTHLSVDTADIDECQRSNAKWFPHNKGGNYRNWYGNRELVVNFENAGQNIKEYGQRTGASFDINARDVYFREGITWTALTSSKNSFRYSPKGCIFDSNKGPMIFPKNENELLYLLALLISPVAQSVFNILNPSLSLQNGDVDKLPVIMNCGISDTVSNMARHNVAMAKQDWDATETSWDFRVHPLLRSCPSVAQSYSEWERESIERFSQIKKNEESLNQIFLTMYSLQDELSAKITDRAVAAKKADMKRDIKTLISYSVGCMFGRYSLDFDGLVYAGGLWDNSKYTRYNPDSDNCIPITDEEYFDDDMVGRFVEFICTVYGETMLEDNLDFISNALGNKGNSSREIIRDYFLNDFFKDHCSAYSVTGSGKRPIYWLFDSGKQNGFKALVYMHRWNADTTGNVRVEYLHKVQKVYESEITRMQETIANSTNSREVATSQKRKEKLVKQLKEAKDYDAKIAHLALSRIDIDLDDGVKDNYEKVQTGQDGKFIEILAAIK